MVTRFASHGKAALSMANTPSATQTAKSWFSSAMKSGSVKWFDVKKGYGFISPEDGSEDGMYYTQLNVLFILGLLKSTITNYLINIKIILSTAADGIVTGSQKTT